MNVAILIPLRVSASEGFVKHLAEIIPRWKYTNRIGNIGIFTPTGMLDALETLGVELVRVPRDDYRTGFSRMGELVRNGSYDVVLNLTARPVKLNGLPFVTMVQNIEPIQTPNYTMPFVWRMRLWVLRREHAIACRKATRVLAVSKYAKKEVCRRFHLRPELVDVVYHGFNPSEVASVRKPDLNIREGEFIFCAGSIVPYRGYEEIIRALAIIRSRGCMVPCTVFAGCGVSQGISYERSLKKLVKALHINEDIIWAGQLNREEMSWCFQGAKVFIQSSRAEACPNIVLESMGHGCPSISNDQPPMPEFYKDAALIYPRGDTALLASLIMRVFQTNNDEDKFMRDRARQRASFFSWDKTAEKTLDVLEQAMRDFRGGE